MKQGAGKGGLVLTPPSRGRRRSACRAQPMGPAPLRLQPLQGMRSEQRCLCEGHRIEGYIGGAWTDGGKEVRRPPIGWGAAAACGDRRTWLCARACPGVSLAPSVQCTTGEYTFPIWRGPPDERSCAPPRRTPSGTASRHWQCWMSEPPTSVGLLPARHLYLVPTTASRCWLPEDGASAAGAAGKLCRQAVPPRRRNAGRAGTDPLPHAEPPCALCSCTRCGAAATSSRHASQASARSLGGSAWTLTRWRSGEPPERLATRTRAANP